LSLNVIQKQFRFAGCICFIYIGWQHGENALHEM
jgi:hypothetical protein